MTEKAKNIIDGTKKAVKLMNGVGLMKITNWAVSAIMPATVSLPVRVCVRVASWALNGVLEQKTNQYIDETVDAVTGAIDSVDEANKAAESDDAEDDTENVETIGEIKVDDNLKNDLSSFLSGTDFQKFMEDVKRKIDALNNEGGEEDA